MSDVLVQHRLPSPEEKAQVAAQVFAAQVVQLDVTGKGFERMTQFRRSLVTNVEYETQERDGKTQQQQQQHRSSQRSKRHAKKKKQQQQKRRNTIACDGDRNDIQDAFLEHCALSKRLDQTKYVPKAVAVAVVFVAVSS